MNYYNLGLLIAQILAALGTLGGGIAIFTAGADKRKLRAEAGKFSADAASEISSSAIALLEPTREQVKFLHDELTSMKSELADRNKEIAQLRMILSDLNYELRAAHRELAAIRRSAQGVSDPTDVS